MMLTGKNRIVWKAKNDLYFKERDNLIVTILLLMQTFLAIFF